MNKRFAKAYKEVLEIIKYFPEEEYAKIPVEKIEFYKYNMDNNYNFTINPAIDLSKQNISKEANAIIVNLFTDYFATKEQKAKINEILDLNQKKEEQEKREKYNPDYIFKKIDKKEVFDIKQSKDNNTANLIEYKESFFTKVKNFIFKIFAKVKGNENSKNKIEMIIFDLDGTLWNTEDISYEVINEIVEKYDFIEKISKDTVAKTMGCTFDETAEMYMPYLEKEKREEILQEILDATSKKLTEVGGIIYDGLEEVLIELKKKYKLAIVSNCAAGYIESFLYSSNLTNYFEDFAAAAKMKVSKTEAIKEVLKRNNITKAIYVGDTIKDFEASQGAEMEFIQAKYGFGQDLKTKYFINKITELPDVLNNIVI